MQASEARRQFYLGVAGVRLWYARDALPGAAPSPDYDFGEEVAVSVPVVPDIVVSKARAAAPSVPAVEVPARDTSRKLDLQSLMKAVEAPAVVPESAPVQAPEAEAAGDPVSVPPEGPEAGEGDAGIEPPPELNIHIWSGHNFTLIAGISEQASLRLQETLAVNILRSLGESSPASIAEVHWPLFNNYKVPGNSVQDLRRVVSQVLGGTEGRKLLVVGVMPGGADESVIPWLEQPPVVLFPHTLAELAADGSLKRSLWQLLKPLAGA